MKASMDTKVLAHQGAMWMSTLGIEAADMISQPQRSVIVDAGRQLIAEIRMSGTKFLSRKSAKAKALTSASIGAPSTDIPDGVGPAIGVATDGCVTGLLGGLPTNVDSVVLGGIGVRSGPGPQDIKVAEAALNAIGTLS